MRKSIIKDYRQGFALSLDMLLLPYIPHTHCTPLGMVDLDKRFKKLHLVFDSTFRPSNTLFAINNWTNKSTEPPVFFACSFKHCLVWTWNACITYPNEEIYPINNAITSGFCHVKYHPNLIAMHSYIVYGMCFMATGQIFSNTCSPGNFECIRLACQQVAQHI
jgi:hypothetical protein